MPFSQWEAAGVLEPTVGDLVDYDVTVDFIRDVAQRFHVRGVGIDMAGATAAVTRLQRELGPNLVLRFRRLSNT